MNEFDIKLGHLFPKLLSKAKLGPSFGVEIEVEFNKSFPTPTGFTSHVEHSIKSSEEFPLACEYVFKTPVDYYASRNLVKAFYTKLQEANTKEEVNEHSPRTAVHIHTNMLGLSFREILTRLTCYYFLENCIIHNMGPSREATTFSQPICRAPGPVFTLYGIISKVSGKNAGLGSQIQYGLTDQIRYSAMNLSSIRKFGSLEFRPIPTLATPDLVLDCLALLRGIFYGNLIPKNFSQPHEVFDCLLDKGPETWLNKVLTPPMQNRFVKNVPDWPTEIISNVEWVVIYAYKELPKEIQV